MTGGGASDPPAAGRAAPDRALFRHSCRLRVRNYEIDWQGIVHNAVYLQYFETGRIAYLEELGVKVDIAAIQHDSRVVVARNEIDYRSPARFGQTLTVRTRVSRVGRTSFVFEGLLEDALTGRLVAENVSVHVWLDEAGGAPVPVPESFRRLVVAFEGRNLEIGPESDPQAPSGRPGE